MTVTKRKKEKKQLSSDLHLPQSSDCVTAQC